jgi:K+-sensing histidine kinase KdpD
MPALARMERSIARRSWLAATLLPVLVSLVLVAATTAAIAGLLQFVDLGAVGIIYLIPVLVAALRLGLVPALIAAMTSVAASAFFFYPPLYDFRVNSWEQVIDLLLFTFVAIVTSQLATSLKRHAEITNMRAKTDQLREALIGSVSHELRTPLASILGAASVIGQAPAVAGDARLMALANMVRDEAERLNNDIQNLLDATRISSEGIRPNLESIDPTDIVNAAVERRHRRLAEHRTNIEISNELPFMSGDTILIEQALGQILDNAAKYSPAGSTIRIAVISDGQRVTLSVADEGAGLAEQERVRVKERFYRGERHVATTTGSGLGLWIADSFIAACGGRIDVSSKGVGCGTKVSISLPVSQRDLQDMESGADD